MKINKLFKKKIQNWKEIEKKIELLPSTKQRGDAFEEFAYVYFNLNKTLYQISEVYMEKNIPLKYKRKFDLEKKDCGVDGLIIHNDGTATAYQVKFRTNRQKPSYDELSKFWVEAKKTDHHLTVANCYSLSRLCGKHKKHLSLLVDEFDSLSNEFFKESPLLPVEIVLAPAWWFHNEGITFDEDFFYHPAKRVEMERKMEQVPSC